MAATATPPPRDARILEPPCDRPHAHPIERRKLPSRQAVRNVAAAKLRRGGASMASAALGPGARRDAELPQPAADGAAAHPEPLADLHRRQPLPLVKPAQLGRRNASAHPHGSSPTAPPCVADTGWFQRARESPKARSEEHTSELQSRPHLVCRL